VPTFYFHISSLFAKHNVSTIHILVKKISSMLTPVRYSLDVKTRDIHCIASVCSKKMWDRWTAAQTGCKELKLEVQAQTNTNFICLGTWCNVQWDKCRWWLAETDRLWNM
jgi:hypothetical protein